MNKRGSMFDFYSVLLVVVMCGLVLLSVAQGNATLAGSLVSPFPVLEVRDDLESFEMAEVKLIGRSLGGFEFGSEGFEDVFLSNFVGGLDSEMKSFILKDLFFEGRNLEEGSFVEDSFFENVLYSVDVEGDSLVLTRNVVGKNFDLIAAKKTDVNFPVDVYFEYGAEYLIREIDGKFLVRRV